MRVLVGVLLDGAGDFDVLLRVVRRRAMVREHRNRNRQKYRKHSEDSDDLVHAADSPIERRESECKIQNSSLSLDCFGG